MSDEQLYYKASKCNISGVSYEESRCNKRF